MVKSRTCRSNFSARSIPYLASVRLIARPLNCSFGHFIEMREDSISDACSSWLAFDDRAIHFANVLDALVRVRVVTDDIAETDEVGALVLARVGEHGLERFEIGVNVT